MLVEEGVDVPDKLKQEEIFPFGDYAIVKKNYIRRLRLAYSSDHFLVFVKFRFPPSATAPPTTPMKAEEKKEDSVLKESKVVLTKATVSAKKVLEEVTKIPKEVARSIGVQPKRLQSKEEAPVKKVVQNKSTKKPTKKSSDEEEPEPVQAKREAPKKQARVPVPRKSSKDKAPQDE